MLADLARRGLVVTRPGSGTFTAAAAAAARARPTCPGRPWRSAAGPGLGADLERLVEPPPSGLDRRWPAASSTSGCSRSGLLAAAAARAAAGRRPGAGCPPRACPSCAATSPPRPAAAADRPARADRARRPGRAVGGVPAPVRARRPGRSSSRRPTSARWPRPGRPGWRWCRCPATRDGVLPDALADALARTGARLVYLQPRYANPSGAVLAPDRRGPVLAGRRQGRRVPARGRLDARLRPRRRRRRRR